jgi:hypothetical protein
MARGWGRSEEDQGADKEEQRRRARAAGPATRDERHAAERRRSLELSLARVADELEHTAHEARRQALEVARRELEEALAALG